MSYVLKNIYEKFVSEINELERMVLTLSRQDQSIDRDTHIEGCYIRFVVNWELFIEEYFLRCLCGGRTRCNKTIKPLSSQPNNLNDAFKKLNRNRRDRDKDFIDWLDTNILTQRINDYFRINSRVQKIAHAPDRLFEVMIIRNAIAHRSKSSIIKFEKYVKDQIGYLARLNPTMADLLIQKRR